MVQRTDYPRVNGYWDNRCSKKCVSRIAFNQNCKQIAAIGMKLKRLKSNTPRILIPLRPILGVLQIGIRAKVIENQAPKSLRSTRVPPVTPAPNEPTTTVTEAQLQALIDQGVAAAMAEAEASRQLAKSNSRLALCKTMLLHGGIPIKTTTPEVAHAMPWAALKKMMTDKYCRGEVDKIEKYIGGLQICDTWQCKSIKAERKRKYGDLSQNNQNQQNRRQNTSQDYAGRHGGPEAILKGSKPSMFQCNGHHEAGPVHLVQRAMVAFECGAQGHFKRNCPKLNNNDRGNQAGNNRAPAKVSFVSTAFSTLLDIVPNTLDHGYNVELADGRIIGVNTILMGCTLNFLNHPFNINLMPVEMGSFDAIIGMDWLSKYSAVIDCAKKIVRIPSGSEILIVHGDGCSEGHRRD
ncbi:putative reverse transcriptase domain-containing protein [Tanacetum coccineum]